MILPVELLLLCLDLGQLAHQLTRVQEFVHHAARLHGTALFVAAAGPRWRYFELGLFLRLVLGRAQQAFDSHGAVFFRGRCFRGRPL